jgi:hypothetical protein
MSNRQELAARLKELGTNATVRPWELRQHPHMPPFIQAKPANPLKLGYGLEVFGEDYTGYGDAEQRAHDLKLASFVANNLDAIIKLLEQPEATVEIKELPAPLVKTDLPETRDPLADFKV